MVFGVKGQWKCLIKINDLELDPESIQNLTVIEEAGNILPVIELQLSVINNTLFESINNASSLNIMLTKDDKDEDMFTEFLILKNHNLPATPGAHVINLKGILNVQSYFLNQVIASYDDSAVNVIAACLQENNLTPVIKHPSADRQKWIRYNQTAQKFISETLKHTYADDNSAFSLGIGFNKKAIIADLTKVLQEVPKENLMSFSTKSEGAKVYNLIQPIRNNFGFYDTLTKAGRSILNFDQIRGTYKSYVYTPDKITTSDMPSLDKFNRVSAFDHMNDNTYDNYYLASLTQSANLAKLSNFATYVEFGNQFIDVNLLDGYTVIFPPDNTSSNLASEIYSGKWVITKIIRFIQSNKLLTTVEISREGINTLKKNN